MPADLLDTTSENNLRGVKIRALDGERFSLNSMDDKEFSAFRDRTRHLNLDIYIETNALGRTFTDETVTITLKTGASSVRLYPRYEGSLYGVLSIIVNGIAYVRETYQGSGLIFTIEQHKNLGSHELVSLVKGNGVKSSFLLFDSASVISASKHSIDALKTMAPRITQVHTKDALIVKGPGGLDHKAYISGQGDMPFKALLTHPICLSDDEPQVVTYSLEGEVDYCVPVFHFEGEGDNPWIPYRQISETPLSKNHLLDARLHKEKGDAINQINHVHNVLQ